MKLIIVSKAKFQSLRQKDFGDDFIHEGKPCRIGYASRDKEGRVITIEAFPITQMGGSRDGSVFGFVSE
jgi:hypothetical protein